MMYYDPTPTPISLLKFRDARRTVAIQTIKGTPLPVLIEQVNEINNKFAKGESFTVDTDLKIEVHKAFYRAMSKSKSYEIKQAQVLKHRLSYLTKYLDSGINITDFTELKVQLALGAKSTDPDVLAFLYSNSEKESVRVLQEFSNMLKQEINLIADKDIFLLAIKESVYAEVNYLINKLISN